MANNEVGPPIKIPELGDLMPMEPAKGPPLPRFLQIFWPWYKEEEPPTPPAGAYSCPYCDQAFDSIPELAAHVSEVHPDKPPIGEIEISWE